MSLVTNARIEREEKKFNLDEVENSKNAVYFSDRNKLEKEKLKYVSDDDFWVLRRLSVNILLKQNPKNISCSWVGPFEWDGDIVYMGLGNYIFRRSDYERRLNHQRG